MLSVAELDALEAKPLTRRRMYVACDCTCPCGHESLEAPVALVTCRFCGDVGEKHYLVVPVTSHGWTIRYGARRGHDDDDPAARADGRACEGATAEVTA